MSATILTFEPRKTQDAKPKRKIRNSNNMLQHDNCASPTKDNAHVVQLRIVPSFADIQLEDDRATEQRFEEETQENKERLARERFNTNQKVKRSYGIKTS